MWRELPLGQWRPAALCHIIDPSHLLQQSIICSINASSVTRVGAMYDDDDDDGVMLGGISMGN